MSYMHKAPNPEKGVRYLGQLDQALCSGNWSNIQELARKTDKHALDRKCFTLTARSEAQIASATHRPTSASSSATSSIHGLGELVPKLEEAISGESKHPEDVHAANVCLAEIHWLQEDLEAALKAVAQDGITAESNGSHVSALGWLEVCEVKARLIKAAAFESTCQQDDAMQTYFSAVQRTPGSRTVELRRWTERLLARACMFMYQRTTAPTTQKLSLSLRCFLAWSDFWQRSPPPDSGSNSHLDIPRRRVWKAYYDLLSSVLQYGLMYNNEPSSLSDLITMPPEDVSDDRFTKAKSRQRSALRRVEATYESLILNETQFPKASETNTEVEEWAQQAVSNWKILCGPNWTDSELGDGGKESVSRGLLDILYRAATKTFHSTAILRYLFVVHAALGEFHLAMHAFNSYVEIVSKGKARAEKTGKHELGFDGDDTAVLTACEAVNVLCKYGDREQAEKAIQVGTNISKWLGREKQTSTEDAKTNSNDNRAEEAQHASQSTDSVLQAKTLAAAYRAIGTSQAHWANITYDTESRSGLQAEALDNFKRSLSYEQESIETAYALALLLAESRNVSAATQVIKRVIASSSLAGEEEEEPPSNYTRQIRLIPLWHLLALCLTAKDDYEQGIEMCDAAFEQFGEPAVLFGEPNARASSDSEEPLPRSQRGLVDQMDGFEKEGILQVKITQLSFVELTEGADAAVDMSHELLGLYVRLFGNPELKHAVPKPPPTAASVAPSKFGGTLRSIAGSIRPRSAGPHSSEKNSVMSKPERGGTATGGDPNGSSVGVPVSITVTNEDGVPTEKSHHRHPFKLRGVQGDWRENGNLKSAKSAENLRRSPSPIPEEKPATLPQITHTTPNHLSEKDASPAFMPTVEKSAPPEAPTSPGQQTKEMDHNASPDAWPPPGGRNDQPPHQDIRLPAPHPSSHSLPNARFPTAQDRQHKISILVEVWLFIAGLYLRADLAEDAISAVNEASKLVESFELHVANENSSAKRFFDKGWGGGKSVDGLWADVYSAKGDLSSAREFPFEAISQYELALSHSPDHPEGSIGLSNLLMDIYEEKIPTEEPRETLHSQILIPPAPQSTDKTSSTEENTPANPPPNTKSSQQAPTTAELNRLASRDRAYMLLSNLTRLGSGWDDSEAWRALARAHELSKQIGKAKQALWWVVELEEDRPMRPWLDVSPGGFVL